MKVSTLRWDGQVCTVMDAPQGKRCRSPQYNFDFDKNSGFFVRWGASIKEDPPYSPFGPEIADIEVVKGNCKNSCPHCYKDNGSGPATWMRASKFERILRKFPPTLTQVALGITGIKSNPELWDIMSVCRHANVVPNITISGADADEHDCKKLAKVCGAVAVSVYPGRKDEAYRAVRWLIGNGMRQVNLHVMTARESMEHVLSVVDDAAKIEHLHAVVFLGVKPKGRAKAVFNPASTKEYEQIVQRCMDAQTGFGFDSCSATMFNHILEKNGFDGFRKDLVKMMVEPCESDLFSTYVDVDEKMWHCSFAADETGVEAVDMDNVNDFLLDAWYAPQTVAFRQHVLDSRTANKPCHLHNVAEP